MLSLSPAKNFDFRNSGCQTESPAGYHWYPTSNPTQRGVETPWGWLQVSQGTGTWTCPVDGRAIAVLTDFHDFSNIKNTEFVCPVKLWQWEWNIYQKRPWPNDSAGQPRGPYEFPNGAMPRSACLRMPSHAQRPLAQLDGRRGCVMHLDARLIIQVYQGRGEWWYDGVMMCFLRRIVPPKSLGPIRKQVHRIPQPHSAIQCTFAAGKQAGRLC